MEQLHLLEDRSAHPLSCSPEGLVIRESRRARRLILQLIPPYTLELVVPRGTRPKAVESFLRENRAWIDGARRELWRRYPLERRGLPQRIELTAIGQCWRVEYAHDASARPRCRVVDGRLQLTVRADERGAAGHLLRGWLMGMARHHLKPWLWREARRLHLTPSRVQIRTQRTRWGSCSAQGTISLNASLLFVEPAVTGYLLVHELSHLRHLDHSRSFWRLVERFEPDYRRLDRALSESWTRVPAWALKY